MKRIAILLGVACASLAVAATVPKYHSAVVDISKVTGNYNSWRWVWPGYSAQEVYLTFTNGSASVDLTGYTGLFKVATKTSAGQTAYISLTNVTMTSSSATFRVEYTNVPPDGEYLSEFWIYATTATSNARVLGQGKVVAIDSLYGTDDSSYPWPSNQASLADYVPITRTITIDGVAGTLSSNLSFTVDTDTTFTNYLSGDTEIVVAGEGRSGSNTLSIAASIARDSEVVAATGAVYSAAVAACDPAGSAAAVSNWVAGEAYLTETEADSLYDSIGSSAAASNGAVVVASNSAAAIYVPATGGTFTGNPIIPLASETNHAVPYGQMEDLLSDLATVTLYGSTNHGTIFTASGTLVDEQPTNSQSVATALATGTNYVGEFMYETPIDGGLPAEAVVGRFWYAKSANTTVYAYMQVIAVCTNTATTNIIGTSAQKILTSTVITSDRLTADVDATECDGQFLGVRFYLVRSGNPGVTVTTYMGTPYDTHLEGNGFGGVSGYVPTTRTITLNGVAGTLSSNLAFSTAGLYDSIGSAAAASNGAVTVASNSAAGLYVPYTGATGPVNLGSHALTAGAVTSAVGTIADIWCEGLEVDEGADFTHDITVGGTIYGTATNATGLSLAGNAKLNGKWLSGDGGDEGVTIASTGEVCINTNTPSPGVNAKAALTIVPPGVFAQGIVDMFSVTNIGGCLLRGLTARGTKAAPTAVVDGTVLFGIYGLGYDGSSLFNNTQAAHLKYLTTEDWTTGHNGTAIVLGTTPTNASTSAEAIRVLGDRRIRMANHASPHNGTEAGYGWIGASNSEVYVWDGSGNRTLVSPHDEASNELVKRSENPYSGVSEEINLTKLAQAVERLLPEGDPLKGAIYKRIEGVATRDWRADEAAVEAEDVKAVAAWEREPKPEMAKPTIRTPRPIPEWAADAQNRFDAKWVAK